MKTHTNNPNWKKLGVSRDDVEELKKAQNYLCAICKENPATDLDHCHNTDKIRGVLCHQCNTGLGLFKDKPDILVTAAGYLTRHAE